MKQKKTLKEHLSQFFKIFVVSYLTSIAIVYITTSFITVNDLVKLFLFSLILSTMSIYVDYLSDSRRVQPELVDKAKRNKISILVFLFIWGTSSIFLLLATFLRHSKISWWQPVLFCLGMSIVIMGFVMIISGHLSNGKSKNKSIT